MEKTTKELDKLITKEKANIYYVDQQLSCLELGKIYGTT